MGALHDGHIALIERACELSSTVIVSIFVNPLQFESPDDLAKYPRDLLRDRNIALGAGATKVWAPSYEEIYPGEITKQSSGQLGTLFEGAERLGHFDGVLTVIKRLFDLVRPDYAIFGEKDFQQLFIIKRWVSQNQIPVEIIAVPTIRDADGVALSSRNSRLSPAELVSAQVINKALRSKSKDEMRKVLASEPKFELDYAELIDEETFGPVTAKTSLSRGIIAGWINGVRLIDNMRMEADQ